MPLSPNQAAETLKEIEKTGRRSASAHSYASASPYLILWGLVWIAGYTGTAILVGPHRDKSTSLLWLVLNVLGLAASACIGYRQRRDHHADSPTRQEGQRMFASFGIIVLFVVAVDAVMGNIEPAQQAAFVPLLVAMFYAIMGLWRGTRFLTTGLMLTALTIFGFFYLPDYFLYWMAVTGGGALIMAGLWFRQV